MSDPEYTCGVCAGKKIAREVTTCDGCNIWVCSNCAPQHGCFENQPDQEAVDHPSHYGGKDDPYEAIKVIEAWDLNFSLGSAVKYISRAGKKDPAKLVEDLKKASWYCKREAERLEKLNG